jgi:hypothetical protein
VEQILSAHAGAANPAGSEPLRVVLCASEKDAGHGAPGFHDYPIWRDRWAAILGGLDGAVVETADRWPNREQFDTADVIVFFHDNPAWSAEKAADLDRLLKRGRGVVFLHWSVNCYRDPEPLADRLGLVWSAGSKPRAGVLDLTYERHPITVGFPEADRMIDESYWNMTGDSGVISPLATSNEEGEPRPQVWLRQKDGGRVGVCIPGHFTWTHDDPLYRVLVFRMMCWAAGKPLNLLDDAVFVGARFTE